MIGSTSTAYRCLRFAPVIHWETGTRPAEPSMQKEVKGVVLERVTTFGTSSLQDTCEGDLRKAILLI